MRRTFALLALIAVATAAMLGSGGPAAAQADTGTVTVIHGVPGVTVDVYVNDDLTLEDFEPETVTDPLELPAGDYTVDIRAAGADPSEAPIITGSTTLPAGANATLIAHLTADGHARRSACSSTTPPPPRRVRAGWSCATPLPPRPSTCSPVAAAVISGLENPDEETLSLPASTVSASVAAAGTTDPVIGPVDVPVVAGQVTIAYAIGSLEDDTLGAVVQTIQVGEEAAAATLPPLRPPPRCLSPAACPPVTAGSPRMAGRRSRSAAALAAVALALVGTRHLGPAA